MIDRPILDTHVHLWDPLRLDYPWLEAVPAINAPFLLPDFVGVAEPHGVREIVFVECGRTAEHALAEARWVSGLTDARIAVRGIVADAPVASGDGLRAYLMELAHIPRVKGVRAILQGHTDVAGLAAQGDFVRGLQILPEFDLSFDICIKHQQLPPIIDMVRACPETAFILDHIAKPDIAAASLDPWRQQLRDLAALPNVTCKVSGMVTEAAASWTSADLRPYVEHVIDCFGWDRVFYGGDWPVCTLAGSYSDQITALEPILAGCSETEQERFWLLNGRAAYRLDD